MGALEKALWKPQRAKTSKPRTTPGPNPEVRGAVDLGRRRQLPEDKPWQTIPPGAPTPYVTEWAVLWYLSIFGIEPNGRKLVLNRDFFYQRAIATPGLFAKKPFTRADFVLPRFGKGRKGLVINPISVLTHAAMWLDLRQRDVLAAQGWQEIFIDQGPLMRNPRTVIEEALAGIDRSTRGMRLW